MKRNKVRSTELQKTLYKGKACVNGEITKALEKCDDKIITSMFENPSIEQKDKNVNGAIVYKTSSNNFKQNFEKDEYLDESCKHDNEVLENSNFSMTKNKDLKIKRTKHQYGNLYQQETDDLNSKCFKSVTSGLPEKNDERDAYFMNENHKDYFDESSKGFHEFNNKIDMKKSSKLLNSKLMISVGGTNKSTYNSSQSMINTKSHHFNNRSQINPTKELCESQKWIDEVECNKIEEIHIQDQRFKNNRFDIDNQSRECSEKYAVSEIDKPHAKNLNHHKIFKIERRVNKIEKKRHSKMKSKLIDSLHDICEESKPSTAISDSSSSKVPTTTNFYVITKKSKEVNDNFKVDYHEFKEENHRKENEITQNDIHFNAMMETYSFLHSNKVNKIFDPEELIYPTSYQDDLNHEEFYRSSNNCMSYEGQDDQFYYDPLSQASSPSYEINLRCINSERNPFEHN